MNCPEHLVAEVRRGHALEDQDKWSGFGGKHFKSEKLPCCQNNFHGHDMSSVQPVLQIQPVCQVGSRAGACRRCQGCPSARAAPTKGPQAYPEHFGASTNQLEGSHLLLVGLLDGPLKPCNLAPGHLHLYFQGRRQRQGRSVGYWWAAGRRVQNVGVRKMCGKKGSSWQLLGQHCKEGTRRHSCRPFVVLSAPAVCIKTHSSRLHCGREILYTRVAHIFVAWLQNVCTRWPKIGAGGDTAYTPQLTLHCNFIRGFQKSFHGARP